MAYSRVVASREHAAARRGTGTAASHGDKRTEGRARRDSMAGASSEHWKLSAPAGREAGDPGAEQERGRDELGRELRAKEESWSLEQRKGTELC